MAGLVIGARPLFTIGEYSFSDGAVWDLLTDGATRYSTSDPFVMPRYFPKVAPSRENGYNPPSIIDTSNTVAVTPIAGYLPDSCWIFKQLRPGYHAYGQTEDYFGPVFIEGGKFLAIKLDVVSGVPTVRGEHRVSGGFSFGRDFLPGALTVVGIMATAGAIGTALGAPPTIAGTGAAGGAAGAAGVGIGPVAAPAAVADIAPFVGPIEVAAPATSWTLAETVAATAAATKAVGTTALESAKVFTQVVQAAGAAAAVVAAVQGPSSGGSPAPAPAPAPAPTPDPVVDKFGAVFDDLKNKLSHADKKTWYMVGGAVVLLSLG